MGPKPIPFDRSGTATSCILEEAALFINRSLAFLNEGVSGKGMGRREKQKTSENEDVCLLRRVTLPAVAIAITALGAMGYAFYRTDRRINRSVKEGRVEKEKTLVDLIKTKPTVPIGEGDLEILAGELRYLKQFTRERLQREVPGFERLIDLELIDSVDLASFGPGEPALERYAQEQ